jgi:hypothetical protein
MSMNAIGIERFQRVVHESGVTVIQRNRAGVSDFATN